MNKPDGQLTGMDREDIEIAACWPHADSLLDALIDLTLMKKNRKGYAVHDWSDHNPWACGATQRSEQARDAAVTRWTKVKEKRTVNRNAVSMLCAYDEHADSNAPFLSFPFLTLPTQYSSNKEFADAWIEWEKYRKEKKKKLTESTAKKQLELLITFSVSKSVSTINQSIQNGWVGLFPGKVKDQEAEDKMWADMGAT